MALPQVHDLRPADTSSGYDISQSRESIKDGDVLIVSHPWKGQTLTVYAVMVQAWPTSLDFYDTELMDDDSFQFHWFPDLHAADATFYALSFEAAITHACSQPSREGSSVRPALRASKPDPAPTYPVCF